jgi:anaerobic magnesium-protoporphyrin IX monomethyl ester cyclase
VDCIKPELLKVMKSAGCKVLTFGAEPMNPETLRWLKKGFNVDQVRQAVDWCNEVGLTARCSYLIGVGNETEEDVQRSVRLAGSLVNNSGLLGSRTEQGAVTEDDALRLGA